MKLFFVRRSGAMLAVVVAAACGTAAEPEAPSSRRVVVRAPTDVSPATGPSAPITRIGPDANPPEVVVVSDDAASPAAPRRSTTRRAVGPAPPVIEEIVYVVEGPEGASTAASPGSARHSPPEATRETPRPATTTAPIEIEPAPSRRPPAAPAPERPSRVENAAVGAAIGAGVGAVLGGERGAVRGAIGGAVGGASGGRIGAVLGGVLGGGSRGGCFAPRRPVRPLTASSGVFGAVVR